MLFKAKGITNKLSINQLLNVTRKRPGSGSLAFFMRLVFFCRIFNVFGVYIVMLVLVFGVFCVQSDVVLVKAVLKGDRDAFCELVKRHERSVRAVCMSVLQDEHSARDAAQDAFIKAYEKLSKLKDAESFGGWLIMIARTSALDTLKRKTKNRHVELSEHLQAQTAENSIEGDKQELLKAIVRLPNPQRQVVMLRYFGGHSVKEVADISERSVGTVTKQLSRAHKHLKRIMREL